MPVSRQYPQAPFGNQSNHVFMVVSRSCGIVFRTIAHRDLRSPLLSRFCSPARRTTSTMLPTDLPERNGPCSTRIRAFDCMNFDIPGGALKSTMLVKPLPSRPAVTVLPPGTSARIVFALGTCTRTVSRAASGESTLCAWNFSILPSVMRAPTR